jgi:hypothetical protein
MSGKKYTCPSGNGITGGPGTPLPPPHSPLILLGKSKEPDGGPGSRCLEPSEGLLEIPKPSKHLSQESRTEMIRVRNEQDMSQDELNVACSFPHGTINKIENGIHCPTPQQMKEIKDVLGVDMKYV